jgi:hypothetical protein
MCKTFLTDLLEHLEPFMTYMNEQFAPTEAKLARMREYGQFEFDILLYHFEPGMKLVRFDSAGRPDAFVLQSCSLGSSWNGPVVNLHGYAYRFNGDYYERRSVGTEIDQFKGTQRAECLPVVILPSQLEESLKSKLTDPALLVALTLILLQSEVNCTRPWRAYTTRNTKASVS